MEEYHVSQEVASSGLSLYVLGFAMGPLICVYFYPVYQDDHLNRRGISQGVT